MERLSRIGILGAGQLARMLAVSGHPLGASFVTLDPAPDACASAVSSQIIGAYDDPAKLEELAARSDVITYEFENVPAESVRYLSEKKLPVYPSTEALAVARDRLKEKSMFRDLGIPTPAFAAVGSLDELKRIVKETGLPAVLKTRTMGYDGKGQAVIRSESDVDKAWASVSGGRPRLDCILEAFVTFTREISVIAVRSRGGQTSFYPVCQNTHSNGILHYAVCSLNDPMQATAEDYAGRILKHFGYVGALALELFDTGGALMANEIAPRVHNTGHWTIEGAKTSQFQNHIRAVAGLPLGDTAAISPNAMVNFIGQIPPAESVLKIRGAHYHDYGKEIKPGRKVGHATICGDSADDVAEGLRELLALAEIRYA